MTEVQSQDQLDHPGRHSAEQYQHLQPSPVDSRPRPGESFNPTGDISQERTSPLPVFYGNVAMNVRHEVETARRIANSETLGTEAMILAQRVYDQASQPLAPIPIEGGRETTTHKDDYVLNAVGNGVNTVARTILDPEYDGRPVLLSQPEISATATQYLAVNAEFEGILGIDPTDQNEFGYGTAIPGVRVQWDNAQSHDPSRRMLFMNYHRSGAEATGHGEAEPRGRHARGHAPEPGPPHEPTAPVEVVREPKGRHEFQPANEGAQIYAELLAQAPAKAEDAYGPDGIHYARAIRERLQARVAEVNQNPLPQLEHDQTGEAATQFAGAMRNMVDFVDARAGEPNHPNHAVIFQGEDPHHDHTSDLVRLELLQLLGNKSHEKKVRELTDRDGRKTGQKIIDYTIGTEVGGIEMQIQLLKDIGFDGHKNPGTRMRISLQRHQYEWPEE